MIKFKYIIILFFIFSHCSIDSKTGLWKNKEIINNKKILEKTNFNDELTFNEFKNNVIAYSKKSKYPDINK